MRLIRTAATTLFSIFAMTQAHSAGGDKDSLTHLPLPSLITIRAPMLISDVPMCKSSSTMNMYSGVNAQVNAAIAWYTENLKGFKRTHGYGSGRSQDTFYNAAGTIMVSITGQRAAEGENTKVYSIIYTEAQPGVSEKVIVGMNVQKVNCT